MTRISRVALAALAAAALVPVAAAQESYWIANRGSADLMEIDACGNLLQTVPMGTSLRSAQVAPDGKIWVVRFIQSTVDVLNADGTPFTTVTFGLGSVADIAFDANGHAWIAGTTGVEEYDANGVFVAQYALSTSAPLGIAVDADDNKWIAHRVGPPGSVSRIDGTTGVITNHPLGANSGILPTRVIADRRGIGQSSHIWVIGDNRGAGSLTEMDALGNVLNTYIVDGSGNLGSLVADVDPATLTVQNIYVGDFRNGNIWQVDAATGVANLYTAPPDTIGLAMDGFQNLWATSRGVTEVRRIDPATGTIEVPVTVGSGVQSALATGWAHATVVDPIGDLDGDGIPNLFEVQALASPFDACSTPQVSLSVEGPTGINTTTALRVGGSGTTAIAFATATAASGITIPGVGCSFQLEPTTVLPIAVTVPGGTSLAFTIPNDPNLVGIVLSVQGLNISAGTAPAFSNVTCFKFF